jgi:hypothetical protein
MVVRKPSQQPVPRVARKHRQGSGKRDRYAGLQDFLRLPWRTWKTAGPGGFKRLSLNISGQESAMKNWVCEVGRELREVERQISFFRNGVDSAFHRQGSQREPAR